MTPPLLLGYRALSGLVLPFLAKTRVDRLRKAGIPVERAHEVLGHATQAKPAGPLVWVHVASVGEAKSALPLLTSLRRLRPDIRAVVTSFTPGSADVMARHLPDWAVHQFAPLDGRGPVKRFLTHWRPDLAVFVESEIWPNIILTATERDIPLALVNARLSAKSLKRWNTAATSARSVFGQFGLIHCQDNKTADGFYGLGLRHARVGVNLKSVVPAPTPDSAALSALRQAITPRPIWSAVSTHPGEDEIVIEAHTRLRKSFPDALLVLVPRHPERAEDIRQLCRPHSCAQRSAGETPDTATSIYLADTIGETDLWFELAPLCCLCGSFTDVGGHTPFEPAASGAAVLHGPHYANHADAYARFLAQGASLEVQDAKTLSETLERLFRTPDEVLAMTQAAHPLATANHGDVDDLARACLALSGMKAPSHG